MSNLMIGKVAGVRFPTTMIASSRRIPAAFPAPVERKLPAKRPLTCDLSDNFAPVSYRLASGNAKCSPPIFLSNNRLSYNRRSGVSKCTTGTLVLLGARRGGSSTTDWDEKGQRKPPISAEEVYVLRFDGESQGKSGIAGAAAGWVLYDAREGSEVWADGHKLDQAATLNEVSYTALISGLTDALKLGARHIVVQGDNQLIMKQLDGEYKVKSENLKPLFQVVTKLRNEFETFQISQIPKKENDRADELAKNALNGEDVTSHELIQNVECSLAKQDDGVESQQASDMVSQQQDQSSSAQNMLSPDKIYILRFDGGSRGNPGVAGAGMALYDAEEGTEVWSGQKYIGESATNNEAEYTGMLDGMKFAHFLGVRHIVVQGDSLLVVNQLNGKWRVKNEKLRPIFDEAMKLRKKFDSFQINHIRREENSRADMLANEAMDTRRSTN